MTFLKTQAKAMGISYNKNAKPNDVNYEITEKLKDRGDRAGKKVLAQLQTETLAILQETRRQPKMLAKWLYENQGEMRFGAENRLFLVLVDTGDFADSWKLKRNIHLLKPSIDSFLDGFKNRNMKDLGLCFSFKGKPNPFSVLTDVVFIIK